MTTQNSSKLATLSTEQRDALAERALERTPLAQVSLWPNRNMREGKRDAQFTGRLKISTVLMAEVLAKALAEGKSEVECWLDVWHNAPSVGKSGGDRPVLSGRARSFVEPRATVSDAQSDRINALLADAAQS